MVHYDVALHEYILGVLSYAQEERYDLMVTTVQIRAVAVIVWVLFRL